MELSSLVDARQHDPAIHPAAFGAEAPGGAFWTATPSAEAPGERWVVDFTTGAVHTLDREEQALTRCVRP